MENSEEKKKELYRFNYRGMGDYADAQVVKTTYYVQKETPTGYWFSVYPYHNENTKTLKWTSKVSTRRHAYPTVKEALENFIARKKRELLFTEHKVWMPKTSLATAKTMLEDIKKAEDEKAKA